MSLMIDDKVILAPLSTPKLIGLGNYEIKEISKFVEQQRNETSALCIIRKRN
jgi:hypothetical protein